MYAYSFLDLVDVFVAGQFRDDYKVPMRTVRRAHLTLQQELGTKHPFCHGDLYTDGKRIFQHVARAVGEGTLSEVVSRQQFFLHIRKELHHIDYSDVTSLACRWNIASGVVIDPSISMGKPTIRSTGITTLVIANQYYANKEDGELVADLYGIRASDVMNAVSFQGWCKSRRVA
jgi:uncharacterized protein (DUF433 family)